MKKRHYKANIRFAGSPVSVQVQINSVLPLKNLKEAYARDGHMIISLKVLH